DFEVVVEPGVNPAFEEIPGMLVQPLLENAVWHGIRHKEGQGKISLHLKRAGEGLRIVVTDDGVGRAAAAQIAAQGHRAHQSMGLRLVRERLAVAAKIKDVRLHMHIEDLKDADGKPAGTRVTLEKA
ncbi:MAG: ATP-binding protein, partial [Bacteroidota bacterium]